MKNTALLPALLACLPLLAAAQNSRQDSLLRAGDLVGGRPHAAPPRTAGPSRVTATATATTTTRAAALPAGADPILARLLHESVVIGRVPAGEMPGLYDRFLDATRAEHKQWSERDWVEASAALGRLNARYEAVRRDLSLNDRLAVRESQGEFRTLESARRVKDRLGS